MLPDLGETIEVLPQDGYWYVHGHVSHDEAVEAVLVYWEEYLWQDDIDAPKMAGHVWHRYYKWVDAEEEDLFVDGGLPYAFVWCREHDPDAFPVTEIWEQDEWRKHEERKAVKHWLRHETLHRWPDAEIVSVNSWHWDRLKDSSVRFRLPGRTGRDVHSWSAKSPYVMLGAEESWRVPICARLDRFYSRG